jgi:hypothetical protein
MSKSVLFLLLLSIAVLSMEAVARGFDFNDPILVFVDESGKKLTLEEIQVLFSGGTVSMQQSMLPDGKLQIKFIRQTKADQANSMNAKKEWANKWINASFPAFSHSVPLKFTYESSVK